jgi:hypothetical protein
MFVFFLHCDNPWWGVISAWVISSSDFHETSLKAMMRVGGTLAGYFVGLTCSSLTEGNPVGQALALFFNRRDWHVHAVSKQVFLRMDHRICHSPNTNGS